MKKVLFVGGHAATTGECVVKEIKRRKLNFDLYWFGVKKASSDSNDVSFEEKLMRDLGVTFNSFEMGKVQTKFTSYTIPLILKIPISFLEVFVKCIKLNPDILILFGGSICFPASFYGYFFKKKVVVHEQTATSGRANKFSSLFANKILLSRKSSLAHYLNKDTQIIGNPISLKILKYIDKKRRTSVGKIMVTGGSRGSVWINNAFEPIVDKLSSKFKIYWIVGDQNYQKYLSYQNSNIKIYSQLRPDEMIETMADSDIVIGRSGANTVSEIVALKKPSILVPIPWSYNNEQFENALYAQNLGLSTILNQKDLNPVNLYTVIKSIVKNYRDILLKTKNLKSDDIDASKRFVDVIVEELYGKK